MIILGIDTSGYANAVGVVDGEKVLADFVFEARTDSLEKIVANIDFGLKSAGLSLDDVQGFGVGLGPGSWTGIRVGVTVGKILAFSTGLPVCGVPTLEALAFTTGKPVCGVPTLAALAYTARKDAALICPVISVGTGDAVYAAFYRAGDGGVARVGEYYVGDLPGLAGMVKESVVVTGPEAESYSAIIKGVLVSSNISVRAVPAVPRGSTVALLAANRLEHRESDDVLALTPLYLKESTARAFLGRYSGNVQVKRD